MDKTDTLPLMNAALSLIAVLGIMLLLFWLLRRFGQKLGLPVVNIGGRKRLSVSASIAIDGQRRLILVKRDDQEHLLLLGPHQDLLVEQHITPPDEPLISMDEATENRKSSFPSVKVLKTLIFFLVPCLILCLQAFPAMAEGLSISLNGGQQGEGSASSASRIVQMVALITILSLAPGILVMMTSFTRIIVVLSLLRTAIGMQQSPPNAVMTSFAMFLTAFIMAPTMEKAYNEGIAPMIKEEVNEMDGLMKAANPFRQFMLKHAREKDLQMFSNLAEVKPKTIEETPFQVVIPAFMISELRRAFEIGFLIFMPFLIIDMVVASILMAMGMMMLPPATISLPFKIIFFVLVDGWHLIAGSLVRSYGG